MDVSENLTIRDKNGVPRIILSAHERLPSILLMGDDRAEVLIEMEGSSCRFRMRGPGGVDYLLIATKGPHVSMVVFDPEAKSRLCIALDESRSTVTMITRGDDGEKTSTWKLS